MRLPQCGAFSSPENATCFSADRNITIENVPQCVAGIPLWLRQKKSSAEESVYLLDALEEVVFQHYLTIF
jgi:hypothetical protein